MRRLALLALVIAGCDAPLPAVGFQGADACSDPTLASAAYFENTMRPELFDPYCVVCHATAKEGDARRGAPGYLNFDDFESATSVNALVWDRVAAREMPPMARTPSTAELELLVDWLDCTAPVPIGGVPQELDADCQDAALTYIDDAAPVFDQHCTFCHSSTLAGPARNGAPETANYDSAAGVRAVGEAYIWQRIRDAEMPLGLPAVPDDQAIGLHAWLSCGAPE